MPVEINLSFVKKYWVTLTVIGIMLFSFYIRTFNFHYQYLLNVDSYWQYRYMNYIVERGSLPPVDPLMTAPVGSPISKMVFYHYLGAYSYMFFRFFIPGLELWKFLVYFPALLISLGAIPAYYIGKTIYDKRAGLFTSFLVVFSPAIMSRTMGGDPDSDAIVLLLPLIIIALFLFAYKRSEICKKIFDKKVILYSALTGLFLAILAYTWVSFHVAYLITGFVFLKILTDFLTSFFEKGDLKETMKKQMPLLLSYLLITVIFFLLTVPAFGIDFIASTIKGPFSSMEMKAETGNFPNVYVSVAEMMTGGTIRDIAQRVGVLFFFLTFVCCLPYLVGTYMKTRKHIDTAILILLWAGGTLYASMVAVRFGILLATPLCLGSAIVLAKLWRLVLMEDKELFE